MNINVSKCRYSISSAELGRLFDVPHKSLLKKFDPDEVFDSPGRTPLLSPSAVRRVLKDSGTDFSFRVVAHINMRGGIGKTTSTISLATRAAQYGFKTCILDLDSQGSASLALDCCPQDDDLIFYDVWQKPQEQLPKALKKIQDNLFVLPSSLENSLLDSALSNPASQKSAVLGVCQVLKESGFDLVVIDCPPSMGTAVISSICAAHIIVIPVWSDPFSVKGMHLTMEEVEAICDTYGMEMPDIRILYSRFDKREKVSRDTLEYLTQTYPEKLFPWTIRTSSGFTKAISRRESIYACYRQSTAKEDFDRYAQSILELEGIKLKDLDSSDFIETNDRPRSKKRDDNRLIMKEAKLSDGTTEKTEKVVRDDVSLDFNQKKSESSGGINVGETD